MEKVRESPVESYRDELRVFCYWMTASLLEAEELVEEIIFKASSLPETPAANITPYTWLYATGVQICLNVLADRPPRCLPAAAGPPADPAKPPALLHGESSWLEPFPDDLYPEVICAGTKSYGDRKSISLPFIAALQAVQPKERAAFILGGVMGWKTSDIAQALGSSMVDVRRTVDEAREAMARAYSTDSGRREPPSEERSTELFMRYLYPWETADAGGLMERVTDNVVFQILPSPSWYRGREAVGRFISSHILPDNARGRWRLLPCRANGQLACGVYERDDERRVYRAHSLQVLHFEGDMISEIVSFAQPSLFPPFKLLPEVNIQG
jgi:RNA polymerase sigma-70 factor (ECF subfamily)